MTRKGDPGYFPSLKQHYGKQAEELHRLARRLLLKEATYVTGKGLAGSKRPNRAPASSATSPRRRRHSD